MGCPHPVAERVRELEPVWVGGDQFTQADIYFCPDCLEDFACKSNTFEIVSNNSLEGSSNGVQDV